jgi:hypothetical protein
MVIPKHFTTNGMDSPLHLSLLMLWERYLLLAP